MRGNAWRLPTAALIVLVLAAALVISSELGQVSANGGTRLVVKNERVGPYELQVGILPGRPKVGNLHLSILVKDSEAGVTITDAIVMVTVVGPEGATNVGLVQATNTPQNPQFYDVDILLDTEGSWTLTLETDSHLGKASLDAPLEVTASGGFNLVWVAGGAVVVISLSFWAWDRIRSRRRQRRNAYKE